jgi:serine phosphatase RsbU (regulator of sigma subunit)
MLLLKLFPDGKLEYMNCGHIPPLAIHGPTMRKLEGGDLVVGLIAEASYSSAHCVLQAGERVLVVTDGITEAEDPAGNQFGGSEFDMVTQYDTLDKILDRVAHFQAPGLAQDDCTLLEIRYLGAD